MYKSMNKKNILSVLLLLICAILLVGCGKSEATKLWDSYVEAVNSKDIASVAKTFYIDKLNGSDNYLYTKFVEDNQNYFDSFTSIKTLEYKEDIVCDFSSGQVIQTYYHANVKALINGTTEAQLEIYTYSDNTGTFFCTEFNPVVDTKGNKPSDNYINKVYYSNDDYKYFIKDNKATYIEKVDNTKDVVIPATIDGAKVETIGEYAFYKYNKILCFTIPNSKMRNLEISEGIKTISKYAFYQCKSLKELIIPESITLIDKMAFASCTNVEKLEFLSRTQLTNNAEVESTSSVENGFKIVGAHNLQTGEILDLKIDDSLRGVKWSVSSSTILKLTGNRVVALAVGDVEITATDINDPTIFAKVKISVSNTPVSITIANDAFNRLNSLKEIYIHAYNPNSIGIVNGTQFTFNSTCNIYVPKGSLDMYKNHALWSKYSSKIYEFEATEEQLHVDEAKKLYEENVSKDATLNKITSFTNPINIDNVLYLFDYTLNGQGQYLIVDVYTGSIIRDNASAKVFNKEEYKAEELFNVLALGAKNYGDKTIEKDYNNPGIKEKMDVYYNEFFKHLKDNKVLEDSVKLEDVKIVFEDMICEITTSDKVICYAAAELSYKSEGIFADNIVFIKDVDTNTITTYSEGFVSSVSDDLYQGIIELLLSGNEIEKK